MKNSLARVALLVCVLWVLLVFMSWILTAVMPDLALRSLLSAEGIRWFFGHFVTCLATPLLVWLVLGVMAYGVVRNTGLLAIRRPLGVRERYALRVVALEFGLIVSVMLLLTLLPQALLLSVTGGLLYSSFSTSLIPVICFSLVVMGITYGTVTGRLTCLGDAYTALTSGFDVAGGIFVFYILLVMLYSSVCFVFML